MVAAMQRALADEGRAALAGYLEKARPRWIFDHSSQVGLP